MPSQIRLRIMAQKFGMTWWGEQWLNALSRIDYSNRLPRGATYARKGAVLRIDVKDNLVAAKVQGSRKKPQTQSDSPFQRVDCSHLSRLAESLCQLLSPNPAVEAQATDRAYRIGQHQNVLVHRFITRNTFEERIDAMIQQKKDLAELTVATGESWIGKLSNTELHEIFERRE